MSDGTHNYKFSSRLKLNNSFVSKKLIVCVTVLSVFIGSLFYFSPSLKHKVVETYDSSFFGIYTVMNHFNDSVISKKNSVINHMGLEEKYRQLESENEELKSQMINYQNILSENQSLKRMLKYSVSNHRRVLTTKFFTHSVDGYVDFARIPVGKSNGIKENDIVVEGEKLVGRVTDVEENYSKVILVTSPDLKLPVLFASTNVKAVLRGSHDGKLFVTLLNVNNLLPQKDELVITSGDGYHFPSGIAVGIVTKSEQDSIEITPFFDYKKVNLVTILRD